MAITGNLELGKDYLHKNVNFMDESNRGCNVLKKILNKKIIGAEQSSEFRIDLVGALHTFEERYLDPRDKEKLLIILKSLIGGKKVKIVRKKVE